MVTKPKARLDKLEKAIHPEPGPRIVVCWHQEGEPCDCVEPEDGKLIQVRYVDWDEIDEVITDDNEQNSRT